VNGEIILEAPQTLLGNSLAMRHFTVAEKKRSAQATRILPRFVRSHAETANNTAVGFASVASLREKKFWNH